MKSIHRNNHTAILFLATCSIISMALLTGCSLDRSIDWSQECRIDPSWPKNRFISPRIGLIADSQIATDKSIRNVTIYRNKLSDLFIKTSIRPPASDHLSQYNLEYLLRELCTTSDLIIYLGDGANNGCQDEVENLFTILKKYRDLKPIFVIIGNHDYLGAGNTTDPDHRRGLCSDDPENTSNRPLSKLELIEKIHEFNMDNYCIDGFEEKWEYVDSFDSNRCREDCMFLGNDQHQNKGCYLAGKIYNKKFGTEILLVDSSDYGDADLPLKMGRHGFYGGGGSISWKCGYSQVKWFECNQCNNAKVRIIASHYPLEDCGFPLTKSVGRPSPLLEPKPINGNYWISAHTHREKPRKYSQPITKPRARCAFLYYFFKDMFFPSNQYNIPCLNIGSTTDWKPHAVMAGITDQNEIDIDTICFCGEDSDWCRDVIESLAGKDPLNGRYGCVMDESEGHIIFGLTTDYLKKAWTPYDQRESTRNIERFVEQYKKQGLPEGVDELTLRACLADLAAKNEGARKK